MFLRVAYGLLGCHPCRVSPPDYVCRSTHNPKVGGSNQPWVVQPVWLPGTTAGTSSPATDIAGRLEWITVYNTRCPAFQKIRVTSRDLSPVANPVSRSGRWARPQEHLLRRPTSPVAWSGSPCTTRVPHGSRCPFLAASAFRILQDRASILLTRHCKRRAAGNLYRRKLMVGILRVNGSCGSSLEGPSCASGSLAEPCGEYSRGRQQLASAAGGVESRRKRRECRGGPLPLQLVHRLE